MLRIVSGLILSVGLAVGAVEVWTDFEGGSLGRVEKVSETHLRLGLQGDRDQDGRNRQANWYYFRVDGVGTEPVRIDLVDLPGEYNYQPNRGAVTKDTPPVISYDGRTWRHVERFSYDAGEPKLTVTVEPKGPQFWIAHVPPYTAKELGELRARVGKHPDFKEEVIGKSVQGRDLLLWTIASGPDDPKRPAVWLMFRQHSWETGSSWAGEGAVRALLADSVEGRELRRRFVWKIFPMCDPDGAARGNVRFNVNGFDLNRNWDVEERVKMPEITAQREAVRAWLKKGRRIALYFSLHNTETGEYLEGRPAGEGDGAFRGLAERFFGILTKETSFAPTTPLRYAGETTTAGMKGRMTVIQGLYRDFGLAAFLMEQRISFNPKLGRLPLVEDRMWFGGELVGAIGKALAE
jgi:hypothetical protein